MRSRFGAGFNFLGRAWSIAGPYWSSEERWSARAFLLVLVLLTLGLVFLNVLYNQWNRAFFEALQNKDVESFGPLILQFGILATLFIAAGVLRVYLTMLLQMRWRIWLTGRFLDAWFSNQVFYRLELGQARTDNPDQRIAEDLRLFTFNSLSLALGLLSSVVTLLSFVTILWVISGPLAIGGLEIPGYMVWVAVLYALVGSGLTHLVGRRLIPINFQQQRVEADLRFGLVRLRENAEGVAMYGGEPAERRDLSGRITRIRENWRQVLRYTKNLTIFTTGYDQVAGVFPLLVAAPRYFSGAITLGVLTQISDAFGQVQGSLSWFVEGYASLANWKATVDRLVTFQEAMRVAASLAQARQGIQVISDGATEVQARHLSLALPDGRVLVHDASLTIAGGERVLIDGPTGAGKSTLFRVLSGIWPFGSGQVQMPARARILFLPQRAYLPISTLREVVAYPAAVGTFSDEATQAVLRDVGLDQLVDQLDTIENWSMRLSVGEQQRVAIARALLHQPDWLFLDEATAALDDATERRMYELLVERLPQAAIVSIAHRSGVAPFHHSQLTLDSHGLRAGETDPSLASA